MEKIHREHYEVEKFTQSYKKQQMRDNLVESLRMRDMFDKEMADNLLRKEAQMNKIV